MPTKERDRKIYAALDAELANALSIERGELRPFNPQAFYSLRSDNDSENSRTSSSFFTTPAGHYSRLHEAIIQYQLSSPSEETTEYSRR